MADESMVRNLAAQADAIWPQEQAVFRAHDLPEAPRILDVGCGTGRFLLQVHRALPRAKLYGLDLSPYYVKRAAEVLSPAVDVSLVVENAEDMPFAGKFFDAVTSGRRGGRRIGR